MAKTIKYCSDCDCSHPINECGGAVPHDRRQDRKRREKVRESELTELTYGYFDPMTFDP